MKCEGDVKQNLKAMKMYHWKKQAKCRNELKKIIEQAKSHESCSAGRSTGHTATKYREQ